MQPTLDVSPPSNHTNFLGHGLKQFYYVSIHTIIQMFVFWKAIEAWYFATLWVGGHAPCISWSKMRSYQAYNSDTNQVRVSEAQCNLHLFANKRRNHGDHPKCNSSLFLLCMLASSCCCFSSSHNCWDLISICTTSTRAAVVQHCKDSIALPIWFVGCAQKSANKGKKTGCNAGKDFPSCSFIWVMRSSLFYKINPLGQFFVLLESSCSSTKDHDQRRASIPSLWKERDVHKKDKNWSYNSIVN